ncbi:twin-arginine translocase TatA/TatE family subunit [Gryllotalpicola reticulitermitis]|uniref:Twin-arginine translocase TatA/TatE family subunit n=1 Tax=Gryllotalpicola reticulitermitis TaxID=1184153 RepID=A0ABV8Q1S4_9MICO
MLGFSFDKLLVIAAIAVMLVGPQRLPLYAQKLGEFVRNIRKYADSARERVREEVGAEVFDDIDWQKLDPRQYDPRRIIRDALFSEDAEEPAQVVGLSSVATRSDEQLAVGALPPFDAEAT